jgi:Mycoplasma protein of unknown function, DUF285
MRPFGLKFKWAFAFNVDLSQWNVSNVQNAAEMFNFVEGYNQSLCSWGTKLPQSADVTGMFLQTGCANASDPSLPMSSSATAAASTSSTTDVRLWSGPFCSVCGQS